MLFPADASQEVWMRPFPLEPPVEVTVDEDGVDVAVAPELEGQAGTIRLVWPSEELTADLAEELAEYLLSLPGVTPTEFGAIARGVVDVPVRRPDEVVDWTVRWIVTPALWVEHTDRIESSLHFEGRSRSVELTPAEAWGLVLALASLRYWQARLQERFADAATRARHELLI
jgi:hypothetical protein